MSEGERLIEMLRLRPHPEGGCFRETFRDAANAEGRACSTAIYFLLRRGEQSRWHRIDAAEIWHWYAGAPLMLSVVGESSGEVGCMILGTDLEKGERPQLVVPARTWQQARSLGDYTLTGCTVAPGFEFSRLELASAGLLPDN
jgi:predicted cupin superfamily sugar epimerase